MLNDDGSKLNNIKKMASLFLNNPIDLLNRVNVLQKQSGSEPLNIVVFGKYNHGKSSLLNALIKQDIFKAEDVRCTIKTQHFNDTEQGITRTDTPGIDADENDDQIAESAIKNADIVLFIHDVISGELDKKELDFMIDYAEGIGKGKLRVVLSKIDQIQVEELVTVEKIIQEQIKPFSNIPLYAISSTRYQKYIKTGSHSFLNKSGFKEFLPVIDQVIKDKEENRRNEINSILDVLLKDLTQAKIKQKTCVAVCLEKLNQQKGAFELAKINLHNHLQ